MEIFVLAIIQISAARPTVYLFSRRESASLGLYQIILLGDKHIGANSFSSELAWGRIRDLLVTTATP